MARVTVGTKSGKPIEMCFQEHGTGHPKALVHGHRRPRDLPFGGSSLGRGAVLGRRPPLLPDFLDDDVSAEVLMPRGKRLLMVRALDVAYYHSEA